MCGLEMLVLVVGVISESGFREHNVLCSATTCYALGWKNKKSTI